MRTANSNLEGAVLDMVIKDALTGGVKKDGDGVGSGQLGGVFDLQSAIRVA
jgi:hypothetical protein